MLRHSQPRHVLPVLRGLAEAVISLQRGPLLFALGVVLEHIDLGRQGHISPFARDSRSGSTE